MACHQQNGACSDPAEVFVQSGLCGMLCSMSAAALGFCFKL